MTLSFKIVPGRGLVHAPRRAQVGLQGFVDQGSQAIADDEAAVNAAQAALTQAQQVQAQENAAFAGSGVDPDPTGQIALAVTNAQKVLAASKAQLAADQKANAPPSTTPSWVLPAAVVGVGAVVLFLATRKKR